MKRTLSLTITSLLIGLLVAYTIYLMTQGAIHPVASQSSNSTIIGVGLIVLLSIIWWYATIGSLSKPKLVLSLGGLIILFYGSYLIIDPINSNTFLSDLTRVVGVYIFIAALTGFIGPAEGGSTTGGGKSVSRIKNAEIIEI